MCCATVCIIVTLCLSIITGKLGALGSHLLAQYMVTLVDHLSSCTYMYVHNTLVVTRAMSTSSILTRCECKFADMEVMLDWGIEVSVESC